MPATLAAVMEGVEIMSAYQVNADTLSLLASVATWGPAGDPVAGRIYWAGDGPLTIAAGEYVTPAGVNPWQVFTVENTAAGFAALCGELATANALSVADRYADKVEPVAGPWSRVISDQVAIGEVFGALNCYVYQASDAIGWPSSFARHYCDAIREGLIRRYVATGWEWTRPADLPQVVSIFELSKGAK